MAKHDVITVRGEDGGRSTVYRVDVRARSPEQAAIEAARPAHQAAPMTPRRCCNSLLTAVMLLTTQTESWANMRYSTRKVDQIAECVSGRGYKQYQSRALSDINRARIDSGAASRRMDRSSSCVCG